MEENLIKPESPTKHRYEIEYGEEDELQTDGKDLTDFAFNDDGSSEGVKDEEHVEYRLPSECHGPPRGSEYRTLQKRRSQGFDRRSGLSSKRPASFYGSEMYEENDEQISYLRIKRHIE